MESPENQKNQLRQAIRKRISLLSISEIEAQSQSIFFELELNPWFIGSKHILLYCSMTREVETSSFIDKWVGVKEIYLPVIMGNALIVVKYSGKENMKKDDKYGIWEPLGTAVTNLSIIDLVIVPALAYDNLGNRLGKGGGYYDKLLPLLPSAFKIGVALKQQMVPHVPALEHDVKMDLVIAGK